MTEPRNPDFMCGADGIARMNAHAIHELPTARLRRRLNCRTLNESNVKNLMEGMRKEGFWKSSPLRVRPIKIRELNNGNIDGWEITSGRHRFEAAWRLNFKTAPCVIVDEDDLHAELAMIDENLCRADLEQGERAKQTARLKIIYEELFPETAHGGDRKSPSRKISNLNRFSKETAAKTGRSESSVQKDARRGEVLGNDNLNNIAGTSLDKGVELDALMKIAPLARREIIDRAKAGEKVSAAAKQHKDAARANAAPAMPAEGTTRKRSHAPRLLKAGAYVEVANMKHARYLGGVCRGQFEHITDCGGNGERRKDGNYDYTVNVRPVISGAHLKKVVRNHSNRAQDHDREREKSEANALLHKLIDLRYETVEWLDNNPNLNYDARAAFARTLQVSAEEFSDISTKILKGMASGNL
jgi:ParB-like chromosome segregation protein Spo0J